MTTIADKLPLYLPVTGRAAFPLPANFESFTLDELRSIVGGNLQMVRLPNGLELWMDEDGLAKRLPVNGRATVLWRASFKDLGVVVGTALVCRPAYTRGPVDK